MVLYVGGKALGRAALLAACIAEAFAGLLSPSITARASLTASEAHVDPPPLTIASRARKIYKISQVSIGIVSDSDREGKKQTGQKFESIVCCHKINKAKTLSR